MEDRTMAARNVLVTILPHFLHFVISYCKSSLNLGEAYWMFTKSSLSYRKKSGESNGRTYTGRTRRFHDFFLPQFLHFMKSLFKSTFNLKGTSLKVY